MFRFRVEGEEQGKTEHRANNIARDARKNKKHKLRQRNGRVDDLKVGKKPEKQQIDTFNINLARCRKPDGKP